MFTAAMHYLRDSLLWKWFISYPMRLINFRLIGYPTLPADAVFKIQDAINADIENNGYAPIYCILSVDKKNLGSFLIRKFTNEKYSHASFIFTNSEYKKEKCADIRNLTVVEMTSSGLNIRSPMELLKEVDNIAIVAFDLLSQSTYDRAINSLQDIIINHPSYDFSLEISTDDKLYCSELIYKVLNNRPYCLKGVDGKNVIFFVSSVDCLGNKCFLPDTVKEQGRVILEI